ncbi:MAG: OmpA family protein [Elusimicrobiales bacterium]|jgi:peptidoglycan-associated lipoprotein
MKTKTFLVSLLAVFTALTAVSCNRKNIKNPGDKTDMTTDISANPALDIQESSGAMSTEGEIRGGEFVSQETIQPIYFDFDKYGLSEETRRTLQKNAEVLKTHRDWTILVEGYCDIRGTVEYNLALGQKRAKEVRDYYTRLGIPESSVGTISYGKEKPSCQEDTETCWEKNRKAETKVRSR